MKLCGGKKNAYEVEQESNIYGHGNTRVFFVS